MHKTHALLTDEVQLAVFNMASVNFDYFFNTVLRGFVGSVDGVAAQQWDVLVRNFVHCDKVGCFVFVFGGCLKCFSCFFGFVGHANVCATFAAFY